MTEDRSGGTPSEEAAGRPGRTSADALAYLAQHHQRYTREALTRQLIDAGYDPGVIEEAWAALATADRDGGQGLATAVFALGIIAVVLVYGGSALLALAGISFASSSGSSSGVGVLVVYLVGILIGGAVVLMLLSRARQRRQGAAPVLVAVAIGVAIYIGASGSCIALLRS